MLSNSTFYQIAFIAVLAIWLIYFIFSLLYPRLKKRRLLLLVALSLSVPPVKFIFSNRVYIINDANQIEEKLLVIPYKFPLKNGSYAILKPKPSLSRLWLVNNGENRAWLEYIAYGDIAKEPLRRRLIKPYSSVMVKNVEYFFEAPPKQIKVSSPRPTAKGWLHR